MGVDHKAGLLISIPTPSNEIEMETMKKMLAKRVSQIRGRLIPAGRRECEVFFSNLQKSFYNYRYFGVSFGF